MRLLVDISIIALVFAALYVSAGEFLRAVSEEPQRRNAQVEQFLER